MIAEESTFAIEKNLINVNTSSQFTESPKMVNENEKNNLILNIKNNYSIMDKEKRK
jgi:hypothetical protein